LAEDLFRGGKVKRKEGRKSIQRGDGKAMAIGNEKKKKKNDTKERLERKRKGQREKRKPAVVV
jgi:hypothetical protein